MRSAVPRCVSLLLVVMCGPAPEPVTSVRASQVANIPHPPSDTDHEVLARLAKERGVLDVAAEELRLAWEKTKAKDAKRAYGVALADAWAFELARTALADFPDELAKVPSGVTQAVLGESDAARVERVTAALVRHDAKAARDEIAPLVDVHASPFVLELAGRVRLALHEPIEARRAFSRARSRIDAAGGKIGMLESAAGGVDTIALRNGIILARSREKYLVGGYQSSATHSMWIETYAPGDPDPLFRVPTGQFSGVAVSADGHAMAISSTPIRDDFVGGRPVQTTHIFDARIGRETSSFERANVRSVTWGVDALLLAEDHDVVVADRAGKVARTLAITGTTGGILYAMRTNGTDDAVPTTYPSQPSTVTTAADGTIAIGASDGAVWIWPNGNKPPFTLKPTTAKPQPLVMRFDGKGRVVVASNDGSLVSWDLATRKSRTLVAPVCTEEEASLGAYGGAPSPQILAQCAQARTAGLSPDTSRVIFASLMGGPRVRDAKTGDGLASLDTLEADAMAFDDPAGTTAWLGGVEGTVDHWNTTTGERIESLAEGGIAGFVQSVSSDGRFVVVAHALNGYRHMDPPKVTVWDTTAHAAVTGFPPDLVSVKFVSGSIAHVVTRTSHVNAFFDLAQNKKVIDFAQDESPYFVFASDARDRFVTLRARQKIIVRDPRGIRREIAISGGLADALTMDRAGHVVCAVTDASELVAWSLDDGRELLRIPASRGSLLSVSPDGKSVAWLPDAKTLVITSIDDHREVARITTKDIAPNNDYMPIRAFAFTSETEGLLVGPGEPGYARVVRWTTGADVKHTELQVLSGERIDVSSAGVATIYDRNDTAHLLRVKDGVLLASIHATRGGGYSAMSRDGAVDASSPEGQSAMLTSVDGASDIAGSSWLGWDRFAVADMLTQAARGVVVAPSMPAHLARSATLQATK